MSYYVLDRCNDGHCLRLQESNFNPAGGFRTYSQARAAMNKYGRHYVYGVCRDDRLVQVKDSYKRRNN